MSLSDAAIPLLGSSHGGGGGGKRNVSKVSRAQCRLLCVSE